MKISIKQYAQVLLDVTRDKEDEKLSEIIKSFANILIAHNQIAKLDRIISAFVILWNKKNGIIEAEISSTNVLSKNIIALLEGYIKTMSMAKEVEVVTKENKDILGGVILKYADNIFDASLSTKLKSLKENIIK